MFNKNKIKFILFLFLLLQSSYAVSWVDYHGGLSVSGAKVVDKNGAPLTLRGMSFYWTVWGGEKFYQAETVKWFVSDWKLNIVRASMGVDVDGGYNGNEEKQVNYVKAVVDAAIDQGIYVLIDFHSHHAEQYTDQAKKFFKLMAQTYGDKPNVIYELFNEPIDQSWPTVKKYAEEVIKEIRAIDPDNMIVVGTPFYSQKVDDASKDRIKDTNIVYGFHFYANSHPFDDRSEWQPASKAIYALSVGLPMMVTEFGECDANGKGSVNLDQTKKWLDWCDKNSISYCKWSVQNFGETSAILKDGVGGNSGWKEDQLKEGAAWYRNRILKLQGAGPGDTTPPDTSDPSRVVLKGEPVRVLAADFAQNEGVKIAGSSDSKTVEYIDGGDWIENSFNIATTGRFEITLGLSSQSGGGSVSLALDETALEEKATFPNTGSYSQYQDTKITTTLPAGVHTLRLTFNGGQGVGNISTLQFVQLTSGIKSGGIQKVRASYKLTSKSSQLYLDLAENDVLDGEVFNAAGSHIGGFSKRAFAAGNALLPLGNKNLKPGMYFVNITSVKNGRIKMPVLVVR